MFPLYGTRELNMFQALWEGNVTERVRAQILFKTLPEVAEMGFGTFPRSLGTLRRVPDRFASCSAAVGEIT